MNNLNRQEEISLIRAQLISKKQHPLVSDKIQSLLKEIGSYEKWGEGFSSLNSIIESFKSRLDCTVLPTHTGDYSIYCWSAVKSIREYTSLLRALARLGWRQDKKPTLPSGSSNAFSFHLVKEDKRGKQSFSITGYLEIDNDDPKACQRIKVGTKMIEQDIFEIKCPDGAIQQ